MGAITDAIARMMAKFSPPPEPTSKDERNEERKTAGGPLVTLGGGSAWDAYTERSKIERTRMARYRDYDGFDEEDSIAAGVLDTYTDHALHSQESDEAQVKVATESAQLKADLETFFDQIQLSDLIWPLTRDMVKFGDAFEEHVFTKGRELVEVAPLTRTMIFRTQDKTTPLEERSPTSTVTVRFGDAEATHFRLRRSREQEYGTSVLAPVRKVYKQLSMMEDGIVVRRLTRATQRYGFIVPTGTMGGEDARRYVQKIREDLKKRRLVTADGKVSVREAPIFQDEDFFLAQPTGEKADIKVLQADGGLGDIGDIQHFLNKFFSGVKVPKAWLGFEQDVNCLGLETRIPCLDGQIRTLDQIIQTYEATGWLPYVYSYDEASKRIAPGRVTWAGMTRRQATVVEVALDDGSVHLCTADHRWMRLDGVWVEAKDLLAGDQLLPLRRRVRRSKSYHGYEQLSDPFGGTELTHLRVAREVMAGQLEGLDRPHVHHKDRSKRNNDPRNLIPLKYEEHLVAHTTDRFETLTEFRKANGAWNRGITKRSCDPRAERLRPLTTIKTLCLVCREWFTVPLSQKKKKVCSHACAGIRSAAKRHGVVGFICEYCGERFRGVKSTVGRKRFCSTQCMYASQRRRTLAACKYCGETFETKVGRPRQFCSKQCSNTYGNKARAGLIPVPNHRVLSVRVLKGMQDTGDITVERFSNFFVADAETGGVLVHNSKATLTEEAIAFARAARRVQVAVRVGLHHLVDSRYVARGIDPASLKYRVLLPAMSTVDEMRDLEVQKLKADIAKIYAVDIKAITNHIVLTRFLGLSDEEAYAIEQDQADQAELEAQVQIAGQQQAIAAQSEQARAAREERVWKEWRIRQLSESARSLALWSLEQKAWERADPADKTVIYLGE